MQRPTFEGRSILIVEDEPLIVMDITQAFEGTGAALTTTNTLMRLRAEGYLSNSVDGHALIRHLNALMRGVRTAAEQDPVDPGVSA